MNTARMLTSIAAVCCALAGCGEPKPPKPPRPSFWSLRLKTLVVEPNNAAEKKAVTAVEAARVDYRYRINKLRDYYSRAGNFDKRTWTERELANLERARAFEWQGVPAILPPKELPGPGVSEAALAEQAVAARNDYKKAAADLADYYGRNNYHYKARVIANMQERLDPIRTYMYIIGAEMPPADLKCDRFSEAADQLYQRAEKLHLSNKGLILMRMGVSYPRQRRALQMFQELVRKFPRSVRLPLSAFYIAEIYKEYFDENIRAVNWYQRAFQWDPTIQEPARFQAAVIYDLRLHDAEAALKLYEQVLEHETWNTSNVDFARGRITELRGLLARISPAAPATQPATKPAAAEKEPPPIRIEPGAEPVPLEPPGSTHYKPSRSITMVPAI